MLNLIKYEFTRKQRMFLAVLVTSVLANVFISLRYGMDSFFALIAPLSIILFSLYTVDVIRMYSMDINKKTGYMLFMTPNSGYKIIAAKVLTGIIEGAILVVFLGLMSFINMALMAGTGDLVTINIGTLPYKEVFSILITLMVIGVLSAILFFMIVYTSITVRKSILDNVKFKGFITFVIFLVLNYVVVKTQFFIFDNFNFNYTVSIHNLNDFPALSELLVMITPYALVTGVFILILGGASGYLLEKKINL